MSKDIKDYTHEELTEEIIRRFASRLRIECVFCRKHLIGHEEAKEHVTLCEKHPLRSALAENLRLLERITELEDEVARLIKG